MTIRHEMEIETIACIGIAVLLAGYFVWKNNQNFQNHFRAVTPIIEQKLPVIMSPTPTISPAPTVDTASQVSPNGKKNLVMKTTHNSDGSRTYEVTAVDTLDNTQQTLYTVTLSGSDTLSIPFNTWSPDNAYVFLQKNTNDALVFRASGQPFTTDQQYLSVLDSFTARNIPNTPAETTGWASPTLLIVDTTKQDGTTGPSYWFEVPDKAIIPLATQF